MVGGFSLDLVLKRGWVFWFGVWKLIVPLGGLGILLVFDKGVFLLRDCIYGILKWKGFVWAVLLLSRTKLGVVSTIFLVSEKGCLGCI